ncbi:putative porin [Xanthomonas sp. WHRI 10064A]|uniref:putative porin n=1 Tax=unclassified Xanthomonas TaxID=2643310 RepID=UPI002B223DFA|nr:MULTISPECIES: putative porin [unclassified Xanthomonas]MEA9585846.1 putative porin [Xanthomonas sp. WHRI 10064B]MEA9614273.1 putative porin [Xanthomonas sp. WHRI 10064A]
MTAPFPPRRVTRLALCLLAMIAAPVVCMAQGASAVDPARISPQVTLRLIDLLVAKGVMTRDQADALIQEAATPMTADVTPPPAGLPYQTQPGAIVVPYVPEPVRAQIKDELRSEVTAQAKREGWATPGALPEWTQRLRLYGDLRLRGEGIFYPDDNYGFFPDFTEINAGNGFDVVGTGNAPFLNTSRNRSRMRIRARLGVQAQIADWITGDIRLVTGADRGPVSTNQTLGGGGNLAKEPIWLDRAALVLQPMRDLDLSFGRFANPFWSSELVFDEDINFDGIAGRYAFAPQSDFAPYVSAGVFPVYNTDLDFGSTNTLKTRSRDKWLYGAELGAQWRMHDDIALRMAFSYFQYDQFEGKRSGACLAPTANDNCDTDGSRPQFQQFGNTLVPIRNIVADPANPAGPQLQYYGYASKFGIANLHAQLELAQFDPVKLLIEADLVKNTRYNAERVRSLGPINNLGNGGAFDGGDHGYLLNLLVGQPRVTEAGQWNASIGYRYLESDAVPDAFADSDFHMGGTNARGMILGGAYGLARNTWLSLRWLSANEISGPPYAVDVLQLDLSAEF